MHEIKDWILNGYSIGIGPIYPSRYDGDRVKVSVRFNRETKNAFLAIEKINEIGGEDAIIDTLQELIDQF